MPGTKPNRNEDEKMLLTKGQKYNQDNLELSGWNNPNDDDLTGYSCWEYFDNESCYLGPDQDGVEPEFELIDEQE
jgi:hypothetical protein